MLEAARVFAQHVLTEGGPDDSARIDFAFRSCVGRSPTRMEKDRLAALLDQQMKGFRRDAKDAAALIDVGSADRPATLGSRKLAAWMVLANVLFNLDETLTKG